MIAHIDRETTDLHTILQRFTHNFLSGCESRSCQSGSRASVARAHNADGGPELSGFGLVLSEVREGVCGDCSPPTLAHGERQAL